jgi:hypothetical protein
MKVESSTEVIQDSVGGEPERSPAKLGKYNYRKDTPVYRWDCSPRGGIVAFLHLPILRNFCGTSHPADTGLKKLRNRIR